VNRAALVDAIRTGTAELGLALPEESTDKLAQLLETLEHWTKRVNLTAIRKVSDMVSGHVLDSLAVLPHLNGDTVLDVGTGAGFPGLPLAIAAPQRQFELLDSHGKKVSFVRHVTRELGLDNVAAVQVRAEDYAPGKRFDTVIARALAAMPRLTALCGHLLAEDGVLLALKGKYPAAELDELPETWEYDVIELEVPGLERHSRHLIVLKQRQEIAA